MPAWRAFQAGAPNGPCRTQMPSTISSGFWSASRSSRTRISSEDQDQQQDPNEDQDQDQNQDQDSRRDQEP